MRDDAHRHLAGLRPTAAAEGEIAVAVDETAVAEGETAVATETVAEGETLAADGIVAEGGSFAAGVLSSRVLSFPADPSAACSSLVDYTPDNCASRLLPPPGY